MAGVAEEASVLEQPAGVLEGRPTDPRIASRMTAYWDRSSSEVSEEQVPSTGMILIISLGPKMQVASPAMHESATVGSFVAGLHLGPATTRYTGEQEGIQIDLTPLAARALFGVPLDEIANRCVDLDDLLGRRIDRMVDELGSMTSWTRRFELVDRELRRLIAAGPQPALESQWLFRQLLAGADDAQVGRLAEQSGRSHRHLAALFKRDVGLAPKSFARLVRFRRAVQMLRAGASLSGASADAGFYDQAHFTREFQSIANTTPGRFRATDAGHSEQSVQFVQDCDSDPL